jgi:hypothetical protein
MAEIRNVDQLRHAIDKGATGDKVRSGDPAAAPLGTDAEAGGTSPSTSEIATDAAATAHRDRAHPSPRSGPLIYLAIVAVIAAALVAIALISAGTAP